MEGANPFAPRRQGIAALVRPQGRVVSKVEVLAAPRRYSARKLNVTAFMRMEVESNGKPTCRLYDKELDTARCQGEPARE